MSELELIFTRFEQSNAFQEKIYLRGKVVIQNNLSLKLHDGRPSHANIDKSELESIGLNVNKILEKKKDGNLNLPKTFKELKKI